MPEKLIKIWMTIFVNFLIGCFCTAFGCPSLLKICLTIFVVYKFCMFCHFAAALRVLSYLPLPYSALSSLMIVPRPIRDAAYDYIAKRRYAWFGKGDSCLVLQEKELLERFIDRDELIDDKESDS